MTEPQFSADDVQVWRVRRRLARWAATAGIGLTVAPVAFVMLAAALRRVVGNELLDAALASWLFAWLAAPVAAVASLILGTRMRVRARSLAAGEGGLRLAGGRRERTISREELSGALVVSRDDEIAEVECALASGDVLIVRPGEAAKPERARALVEALGFGAGQRRVVIPLGGPQQPLSAGCGAVLLGAMATVLATCASAAMASASTSGSGWAGYLIGAVFVGVTLVTARALAPRRIIAGTDGVLFEGAFRTRFFPRSSIFGVERIGQHLTLLVSDGDGVRNVELTNEAGERQEALLRRIRDALDLATPGGLDPRAAMLARGAETVAEWRERLRRMTAPEKGYRAGTIPVDTLVATAADADAPAGARIGAALAIGLGGDAAAKQELRRVIDTTANERLRVAIEEAANGEADEEALAAALEHEQRAGRA